MKRPRDRQGAAALVITLAFIFMISTVMLALAVSMRQDRPAANLHLERARADFLAQDGVERVIATLRQMSADPNRNWMTQPGQLVAGAELSLGTNPSTFDGSVVDPRKVLQYVAPLHSGVTTNPATTPNNAVDRSLANPPNINIPTARNPNTHLITDNSETLTGGAAFAMPVKWIGVLADGTLSSTLTYTESPSTNDASKMIRTYAWTDNPDYRGHHDAVPSVPIIGRYAYWVDDESGKVNYNLAWGRSRQTNINPPSHPSSVEMGFLFDPIDVTRGGTMADTLYAFANTSGRYFNTPKDARQVEASVTDANTQQAFATSLEKNKFELTHYSHDPNTAFFNNQRIVLTTRPERAGWTYSKTANNGQGGWIGVNGKTWDNGGLPRYLRILKGNELRGGSQVQTPDYVPLATANDPIDPGLAYSSSVDYTRLSSTLYDLVLRPAADATSLLPVGYLQRGDWPMVTVGSGTSASIQDKYFGTYQDSTGPNHVNMRSSRLVELALNLIEYVRAKESAQPLITPLTGKYDPTKTVVNSSGLTVPDPKNWFYVNNDAANNTYLGVTRTVYLTECAAWLGRAAQDISPMGGVPIRGPNPNYPNGQNYYKFRVELYLPKNYGVEQVDLTKLYFTISAPWISGLGGNPLKQTNGYSVRGVDLSEIDNPSHPGTSSAPDAQKYLQAGTYATITQSISLYNYKDTPYYVYDPGNPLGPGYDLDSNRPSAVGMRITVGIGAGNTNLDIAPASPSQTISLKIDPIGVDVANATSMEVNDPRVNKSKLDWAVPSGTTRSTFSMPNTRTLAMLNKPAPAVTPQLDTDAQGFVTDVSFYMPAPAGTVYPANGPVIDDNSKGRVLSVAELGYLHTGIEPCSQVYDGSRTINLLAGGVPWRSLRLQPNNQGYNVVPDWALMDLFTAPVAPPNQSNQYVYAPHQTSFGGRINVNTQVQPFNNMARVLPLEALLLNCRRNVGDTALIDINTASTLAQRLYNHDLAAGAAYDANTKGKLYGGAYANGYVSPGEIIEIRGIADNGEASEELVRQMGNIVTTRGNVFSVYTVGQSIKETPGGQIVVTGEQRAQAMVERYLDVSDPAKTPTVRFAPVYYRNLIP